MQKQRSTKAKAAKRPDPPDTRPGARLHHPTAGFTPSGAYEEKFGVFLQEDARLAIEHLGKMTKTMAWCFEIGLKRWRALPAVRRMQEVRRLLRGQGDPYVADHLDGWKIRLRGGRRWSMRYVSENKKGECADLARSLGLGLEVMAGLCVMSGVLDAYGVPVPFNQRLTRALGDVLRDLEERIHKARQHAGLDAPGPGPAGWTTWEDLIAPFAPLPTQSKGKRKGTTATAKGKSQDRSAGAAGRG